MANKAYKFRLYPNKEQEILFNKTFGCVRFIFNKMLGDKIEYYKETKEKLNNTPAQYKKEFEWLKEVDSLALANAQMNLQWWRKAHSFRCGMDSNIKQNRFWNEPNTNVNAFNGKLVSKSLSETD